MAGRYRPKTPEEMEAEHKLIVDVYARAGDISKVTGPSSPMTWQGSLYVFVRLTLWHRWLRPIPARVRAWLPEEPSLRYTAVALGIVATLLGIGVRVLTIAEKLRAMR